MKKNLIAAMGVAALMGGHLFAVPIVYENPASNLYLDGSGSGTVNGSGATGLGDAGCGICGYGGPDTTDFWKFSLATARTVTLIGTRVDPALDLALVVFSGLTSADDSARAGHYIFYDGSSLGLSVVAVGDDEISAAPNPYGDPFLTLSLGAGNYTIAVSGGIGSGTTTTGAYDLTLIDSGDIAVDTPEPSTYMMLGTGLAGLAMMARRKKSS